MDSKRRFDRLPLEIVADCSCVVSVDPVVVPESALVPSPPFQLAVRAVRRRPSREVGAGVARRPHGDAGALRRGGDRLRLRGAADAGQVRADGRRRLRGRPSRDGSLDGRVELFLRLSHQRGPSSASDRRRESHRAHRTRCAASGERLWHVEPQRAWRRASCRHSGPWMSCALDHPWEGVRARASWSEQRQRARAPLRPRRGQCAHGPWLRGPAVSARVEADSTARKSSSAIQRLARTCCQRVECSQLVLVWSTRANSSRCRACACSIPQCSRPASGVKSGQSSCWLKCSLSAGNRFDVTGGHCRTRFAACRPDHCLPLQSAGNAVVDACKGLEGCSECLEQHLPV